MMASKTIVIVDDEPDVLESTAMVVESLGYVAVRVADPALILETVARERPVLLLQDVRMPGLTVASLVASMRSHPATADVPIVFFSANEDLASTAAEHDAWGYLRKPFTAAELAHLLDGLAKLVPPGPKDVQAEIRAVFHDYWNLLSALANYTAVLGASPGLSLEAQAAVHGIDHLLLKLEAKTEQLHLQANAWAGLGDARTRRPEPGFKPTAAP